MSAVASTRWGAAVLAWGLGLAMGGLGTWGCLGGPAPKAEVGEVPQAMAAASVASAAAGPARAGEFAVDVGFAQSMLLHHQQALLMVALTQPRVGEGFGLFVRRMGEVQTEELAELRGWLLGREQPLLAQGDLMGWMKNAPGPLTLAEAAYIDRCAQAPYGMEGMLSPAEVDSLRGLKGDALERRFSELMVRHHEGAISMAGFAARHARSAYVRGVAQHMLKQQAREVRQMRERANR